jgi:integration host factor alpha subunit
MTKAEIISRVCEKAHLSKDDATNVVEAVFEMIKSALEHGEKVKILNFGNFAVRTKRQRKGRNPKTGAEIVIPGHKTLTFKSSLLMKKTVGMTQSDWTKTL